MSGSVCGRCGGLVRSIRKGKSAAQGSLDPGAVITQDAFSCQEGLKCVIQERDHHMMARSPCGPWYGL